MGNCKSDTGSSASKNSRRRKVTLALFGLDNAGKTVTAKGFLGEEVETPTPTIGFSSVDFRHGKHNITMFDLGGGKNIRGIWKNYFAEIHGMVFIIDASAPARLDESKKALAELLKDEMIHGKPLLLLANKQDVTGAMDEMDICDRLQLEDLVNAHKTPCRVEPCSAAVRKNRKMDKSIHDGFSWLLELVEEKWNELSDRVKRDLAKKEAKEHQERAERIERVRRNRELREKEQNANGHEKEEADAEEENDRDVGNPFKPIKHQLERSQKKEEKKTQELERHQRDAGGKTSSRSHPESNSMENAVRKSSRSSRSSDDEITQRPSVRSKHSSDSEEEITERPSITSNHRLNRDDDVIQRRPDQSRSDFEEERLSKTSKHRSDYENGGLRPKGSSNHRTDFDEETEVRRQKNGNQPLKLISPTRITRLKNGSDDDVMDEDEEGSGSVVPSRTSYTRILMPPVPLLRATDTDGHRHWNGRSADGNMTLNNADKKKKKKARFNQTAPAMSPPEPHSSWKNTSSASSFVGLGDPYHSSSTDLLTYYPPRGQERISRTPLQERLFEAKAVEKTNLKRRTKLSDDDEEDADRHRPNTRGAFSYQKPTSSIRATRQPNSHNYNYDNVSDDDEDIVV